MAVTTMDHYSMYDHYFELDDWEDNDEQMQVTLVKRYIRDASNPMETFHGREFRSRLHFDKETVVFPLPIFFGRDIPNNNRGLPIPPMLKVLIALRYYGSSSYQYMWNCVLCSGRGVHNHNAPGSVMHKIPITIIPRDQCENNLKQTHLGKYFKLNEGFGCAAPLSEAELCKVDVGSPLVCDRGDGHYEVAGVYSWDTKCSSSLPGVVASPDTDWINQVLSTPLDTLRAEQPKPVDHLPEDVEQKPGFALGYGK
ncbi:hypothetical protein GE061_001961 [Apolygus lucorum]|uniref:Peptidase S1 domain-containing protein n=1 Tax=Apolygus lucorum TaxID=248454 RepID=A0A8S9X572_APOLU|nr:hypothetical protein GE061_001961 [Apolygus lucorum]